MRYIYIYKYNTNKYLKKPVEEHTNVMSMNMNSMIIKYVD